MSELQKAIEAISYESTHFPKEAFEVIAANKDMAIPYLHAALKKAIEERYELEDGYQLHFYALFLLGEFQSKESFSEIIKLVTLPEDELDYLIGDTVTSGLKDILYNTYDGDMELLKGIIMDVTVDEFVRAEALEVMAQLYLDGVLSEKEWKDFIKQRIYSNEAYCYVSEAYASVICDCHFVDMMPEIRYMLENNFMSEKCMGTYDFCVDEMFAYKDYKKNFCEAPMNAADRLKGWAMFAKEHEPQVDDKRLKEFEKLMKKQTQKPAPVLPKIGRNDKCPCGSGKKYKVCCLNKPKAPIDMIEDVQERNKWLKGYPYVGTDKIEGRIYLEDYYDMESIEIDKILYLGLMHRSGWIGLRDAEAEEKRKRKYLILAFNMFKEKIKKENLSTFEEYDKKFSIHYFCKEWLEELLDLLQDNGNQEIYHDIKNMLEEYCGLDFSESKGMQNVKWRKFGKLQEKCYEYMAGMTKDRKCWEQAFEMLKEIVLEEREINPDFAPQLENLEDITDYQYDIQGWLEDCLDEMEMRGRFRTVLEMCDDLLGMFVWPQYSGSDLKFRKATALGALGKKQEAADYCREWIGKEKENMVAAAAGVYAFIKTGEFGQAEELVDRFIPDKSLCREENDIMFTAASKLYEKMGKKKEKKQVDKALQEYDEYLEEFFMEGDEEELDFGDEDLPF